jgi:hypothetical protein
VLRIEAQNVQYVAGWLRTMGLQDIQTLQGGLRLYFSGPIGQSFSWALDIFPRLVVVTQGLQITDNGVQGFGLTILPGVGFSNLRVVYIAVIAGRNVRNDDPLATLTATWLENTDIAFLSSLECVGSFTLLRIQNLMSLKGLERLRDGSPSAGFSFVNINWNVMTSKLTNVSALAGYARCGLPNQRPDTGSQPYLALAACLACCNGVGTWSGVCNYISRGICY